MQAAGAAAGPRGAQPAPPPPPPPQQQQQQQQQQDGYAPRTPETGPLVADLPPRAGTDDHMSDASARGELTVVTPWFPQGVVKAEVRLADEVQAFYRLNELTREDIAARHLIRSSVQEVVQKIWPGATAKCYGSFAYDLSTPSSHLDLVCEQCGDLSALPVAFPDFCGQTLSLGDFTLAADGQSAHLVAEAGGVTAKVGFFTRQTSARKSVEWVKRQLREHPAAGPVYMVLRALVQQMRLDASQGGLSSYALLVMVLHAAAAFRGTADLGVLLRKVLQYYSQFDFATCAVDAESAQPASRGGCGDDEVVVIDPLNRGNNLAAACRKLSAFVTNMRSCEQALQRWDAPQQTQRRRPLRSYRGRTPLSAIISHKPYTGDRSQRRTSGDGAPASPMCVPASPAVPAQTGPADPYGSPLMSPSFPAAPLPPAQQPRAGVAGAAALPSPCLPHKT
eukprot:TRINITY_DN2179_c0_g1_i1.p1 TRINITY_DN2179_c0_g1~~TRINITY_DN2179_c0_g1_i1.p1  ORF type:complete len:477 (+),score=197.68 TRINITY_DN2179_c0_g1_i1:84-1433(+)